MANEGQEFTPKPLKPAHEVSKGPKQSLGWKIARATGLASFVASLGIATTGNAENVVHGVGDAGSSVSEVFTGSDNPAGLRENGHGAPAYTVDAEGNKVPYVYDATLTFSGLQNENPFAIREDPNTESNRVSDEKLQKAGIKVENGLVVPVEKWKGSTYASGPDGWGEAGYWAKILDRETGDTVGYVQESNVTYDQNSQRLETSFKESINSQAQAKK